MAAAAPVELHIVSDATGETATRLVAALEAQFPDQPVLAQPVRDRRRPGRGRPTPLECRDRREQRPDLVGQFRVAVGVLADRWRLAAPAPAGELVGQRLHGVSGVGGVGHGVALGAGLIPGGVDL